MHLLYSFYILSILAVEILTTSIPKRTLTKPLSSRRSGCGTKPEYCCDTQKFNEPFGDLTRSLISKINTWRAKQRNTCKQTCILSMQKFGKKPSSFNRFDRRLSKYAAKFKAIQSQLPEDSILKEGMKKLWQVIEKRRNDSYVCQKRRRKAGHTSYEFLGFANSKSQTTQKKRNQGLNWHQRFSSGRSFGYQFKESNIGCCENIEAKEWSYLVIADHFLIKFVREFRTRY